MSRDETRIKWYRVPVERETFLRLTASSDWRGLAQILPQLLLAVATGALAFYAWRHLAWPWTVAACYLHATTYAFLGLGGAGHELSHGTPFKTRALNNVFYDLTAFLTWTNPFYFRASHPKHHLWTVHTGLDLEVVLPITLRPIDWLYAFTVNPPILWHLLRTHVRHARGIIRGEWEERIFPENDVNRRRELFVWARMLLAGHLLLAAVFIYFQLYILLALVTFAPFYAGWLNFLCGFTQHVGMQPSVADFRRCCRSVAMNPLLRFLYWNMNYHVEHHMYPGVPFYRLPKLRKAIDASMPPANRGLFHAWREILTILRKQREDPSYYHAAAVPEELVKETATE
jgi:fatty acid desaturase